MKCRTTDNKFFINPVKVGVKSLALLSMSFAVYAATPNHITIALSSISEAVGWYEEYLDTLIFHNSRIGLQTPVEWHSNLPRSSKYIRILNSGLI